MVLNEILLKLKVCVCIFNLLVCLKKSSNGVRVSSWFDTATHIVVEEFQVHSSLIFKNHIVQDNTACHDIFHGFLIPKRAGPRTMANLDCKTLNDLSMSFQAASCTLANSHCFFVLGSLMLLTNVHQGGYIPSAR